ncbi:hypothetical protein ES319_A09G142400v1 [Gossypium barbadense]|uniref:Leucine-rich repeat-containing N-terminal plant-type domain-containing protein n=1 Tax=Gossypium barbadense TaxID=3634 RepID=A0A5J5UHC5_GOSBA|nr:hypothetical protein ES319_A09G142400v1 [Gossypium barbadense]
MRKKLASVLILCLVTVVFSTTDSGDLDVLMQFRDELDNPELLKWPENGGDPCGPPSWNHIYCENSRVTQIQAQGMGLKGTLPKNLNKLSMLKNIGLQRNQLSGKLPSFSGLSNLRYAYLDYNNFDSIPSDFLDGLDNLEVLALDDNNFNASTGWSFPKALENSAQLTNLSCMNCNLIGPLPDFLASMPSLTNLMLSGNRLSGEIQGTFNGSALQMLWLNNQLHGGMTGPIDVVATMESLTVLWLHGNHFTGTIPESIVTGKITTKADVFSFGVVLMELLTGLTALDEDRPEETQYLAAWFWHIKPDKEKLRAAIDPSLDVKDETFESISIIAELAGHCTAREPSQRPDMGHAVNVLAPLVEKWKPLDDDNDDYCAIDYSLPLNQMVKDWQEAEGKDFSYLDLEDSKGSIPARPTGFAESFTSADGR